MKHLPPAFEQRMRALLGHEFSQYQQALQQTPVRAFRVNTDKLSLAAFEAINPFGQEKIPYVENGYYLTYDKVGNHPYHHAGMIYVQEPAAMAPAECVDIQPDWKILDMCAAPGGKSTQLKNKLGEKGVLVSNEIIASRCKILTGNVERLGLHNTVTTCMDSSRIAGIFPHTFDLIMVDAPCSGEGMFRKEEVAVEEWSEGNVAMCARRQREILDNAAKALKSGGIIIYATCTFSLEENEMTVDAFLRDHPDFVLMPVKEAVRQATCDGICFDGCRCRTIREARRFYPHKSKGEGQFMAVLRHTGAPPSCDRPPIKPHRPAEPAVLSFFEDTLCEYNPANLLWYNGKPVYFTPDFPLPEKAAFSCGVTVGEIRKNYIQPHHQFFMAMGSQFKRKIELAPDSEEILRYLHGEELKADCENGWAVVTVNGCALGGVKVSGGKAKNHYPKGLRIK